MKKVLNILLLALVTIVLSVSCSQEVTVDSNFYENNETGTFTVDGRGFATLQDAIDYVRGSRAINDSNTIKLTKNASGPGANVDGSLELCIDFQGYTFSFTNVTGKQGENVSDKSFGLSITDGATVSLKGLQEISLYDSTTNLTMVYVEGSDTSLTIEDSPKMVVEDDQYVFWAANGATLTIGSDSATDTEAFISGKIAATGTTEKKPTVAIKSKTTITGTIQATSANVALYGSSSVEGAIEASASSISVNETSKINASLSAKDASVVVVNTSNSDAGTITTMDKDGGSTVVVSGGTVKIDEIAEGSDTQVEVNGGGTVTSSEITTRNASYVAIIENKLYETLQGAVDAAKAGDTVVLLKDIDLTNYSRGSFGNGFDLSNITLDLNGFKITSNNAGVYYYGTNATIKNGTFVANPNAGNEYYDSYALFLGGRQRALTDTRNSITVENVICYGGINASHPAGIDATIKNSTVYATRYYTVCSQGTGSIVTIEGGTFERKNTDGNKTTPIEGNALFYVSNNSYDGYDDRLIIKSGTFTQASGELLEVFSNTEHTSVLGGVFNVDPSAYVANGYMVNSSTSTTWTVDESVYWIDYSTTAFAGGTGSSEDPYQIETAEQ
nr:hypothetical protein [Sphaerochaetaceae bacterium]